MQNIRKIPRTNFSENLKNFILNPFSPKSLRTSFVLKNHVLSLLKLADILTLCNKSGKLLRAVLKKNSRQMEGRGSDIKELVFLFPDQQISLNTHIHIFLRKKYLCIFT